MHPPLTLNNSNLAWRSLLRSVSDPDSIGSVDQDPDRDFGSRSRKANMTHKKRTKWKNSCFNFWMYLGGRRLLLCFESHSGSCIEVCEENYSIFWQILGIFLTVKFCFFCSSKPWICIWIRDPDPPKNLYPDPDSVNADPKHCGEAYENKLSYFRTHV